MDSDPRIEKTQKKRKMFGEIRERDDGRTSLEWTSYLTYSTKNHPKYSIQQNMNRNNSFQLVASGAFGNVTLLKHFIHGNPFQYLQCLQ